MAASAGGWGGVDGGAEGVGAAAGSLVVEDSEPPKRFFSHFIMRAMLQGGSAAR